MLLLCSVSASQGLQGDAGQAGGPGPKGVAVSIVCLQLTLFCTLYSSAIVLLLYVAVTTFVFFVLFLFCFLWCSGWSWQEGRERSSWSQSECLLSFLSHKTIPRPTYSMHYRHWELSMSVDGPYISAVSSTSLSNDPSIKEWVHIWK